MHAELVPTNSTQIPNSKIPALFHLPSPSLFLLESSSSSSSSSSTCRSNSKSLLVILDFFLELILASTIVAFVLPICSIPTVSARHSPIPVPSGRLLVFLPFWSGFSGPGSGPETGVQHRAFYEGGPVMFTPQRKGRWAGWSASPKLGSKHENGSAVPRTNPSSFGASEATAPPQPLMAENLAEVMGGSGVSEDWFRESGLLRKDKEALSERVSALESERDECLYNMGLLLIEKNEWSSQIEELKQALIESQEILKGEQEARIVSISELEKREENLKKTLGIEKQCVVDLEKALHEKRAEIAEAKFISEKKLADAHAIEANLEEKKMEIEAKVHGADARLAEANRKNSEIDWKLENLAAREYKLQRELSSLNVERKTLETDVAKQREHLLEWEKDLQEKQRRLLNEQRLLNEREERANDVDVILKKKEAEIEDTRKNIDAARSILKCQEDGFKVRLKTLTVKEKDTEIKSSNLEKKEKDLMAIEEKLIARENEEIQKLLDEHNATLDAKKQDFELEMVKKRRSFDEEVKNHMDLLDKEKRQVRCKEEEFIKRKEALDNKTDKLKSKEEDLNTKSKTLEKWEGSLKTDEKKLREERKQLTKDSNELEASRAKLHNEKVAIEAVGQKVVLEKENLKLTLEEREQHLKLQAELKLVKEEYRMMMESLEKEKDVLRQEKEVFERDWEVLDGRRVALEAEVKQLSAEREKFEKWRHTEEERLKNECLQDRTESQRELGDLRLKKEAFEKMMAQERAEVHAEVDRERADMSREFELLKHKLEMNMQRRQDDVEKELKEKESKFETWREVELSHIKSSSESIDLKCKRLEIEQNHLQREKSSFSDQRGKLEADRQEIQNDIDTLLRLSKNLKGQREEFAEEKEMFLSVVEQCKTCHNCGVPIYNTDLLDLQSLRATEGSKEILLPSLADGFLEEHIKGRNTVISPKVPVAGSANSGSHMTRWLQRCASLFKISPKRNAHPPCEDQIGTSFDERLDRAALEEDVDYEPAPSANHSFENQLHFDSGDGISGEPDRVNKTGDEAESSFGVADSSKDIVIHMHNVTPKTMVVINDENNEMQGSSIHAENDSQSEPSKQGRRRQPSRRAKPNLIRRTHSVKAVVEDSKGILGESSELKINEQQNEDAKDSDNIPDDSQGASVQAAQAETRTRQKRRSSELEPEGSEAHSESVSLGGRRKKRQTSLLPPVAGDKRYYLRRTTVASTAAAFQAVSRQKAANAGSHKELQENIREGGLGGERISCHDPQPLGTLENSAHLLQKSAVQNVLEVNSKERVQYESQELHHDDGINESAQFSEQTTGDEVDGAAPARKEDTASNGGSESDDMDDEDSEKHTASIGKKLWHFLTT